MLGNASNQLAKLRIKIWIELNDESPEVYNTGSQIKFKNCAAISGYFCEINNLQTDNTEDINVVMLRYNLIENSDNYLKTGS